MKRRTLITVCLLLLAVGAATLFLAADRSRAQPAPRAAQATYCSSSFCLDWDVLAGGVGAMSSENYRLQATLGQTMAGLFSSTSYELRAGFWNGVRQGQHHSYLPLVVDE